MAEEIPLQRLTPNQRFSVNLAGSTLEFTFHWVARFEYFRVNIRDLTNDAVVITNGRIANPGVNMLREFEQYGRVYIDGEQPTLLNVGKTSKLMWEAPSE